MGLRLCYVGVEASVRGSFILLIFKKTKEMENTDFRIGNFVYGEKQYSETALEILEITRDFILIGCDGEVLQKIENKNIKPILLDEQWLLLFGFKKYNNTDGWFKIKNESYHIEYDKIMIGEITLADCLFLHQIQNFHFLVSNEELICA